MNNYVLKENDNKYSVTKQGSKRALRVFKSKQEALDFIKERNYTLVEETKDIIVNVPLINEQVEVPVKQEKTATTEDSCCQEECDCGPVCVCGPDCECKKLSLFARIIKFFKRKN